jgi:RNA ligase (TIGR02306 family)
MRKLASVRRIDALDPIEGADAIECATVGGWKVVAQKGLYNVGDLAVYFEIDSWIPTTIAPFLSKGKEPREFEGIKGERLKTIKLRGQLSQGLLIPIKELPQVIEMMADLEMSLGTHGAEEEAQQFDLTELLGVVKWEKPINAQLAGVCKGNFPSLIPKTDQERCQNMVKEIVAANERGVKFEITEKMEGSSMTCYLIDGVFGVCSRNMDLKETEGNSFWATARRDGVEDKMREEFGLADFAVQGELIGPGIQGNIYKLGDTQFRVFDIYDIRRGVYVDPQTRHSMVASMGLTHVPVIAYQAELYDTLGITDIPQLLTFAEGKSTLADVEREGVVFKEVNGGMTFKAISNKYLLGEK